MPLPSVSVIIPTYNRPESVIRLLFSLRQQTLAPHEYEVVIVDDGSDYDEYVITDKQYPYSTTYSRQDNQGATIARNNGVNISRGRILVFIDDDITVSETALEALAEVCSREPKILAMGTLISRNTSEELFTRVAIEDENRRYSQNGSIGVDEFIHFSECNTQILALQRDDFFDLGMLQDPTGGWPNWDDVDFGYRSYLAGYRLLRCSKAVGEHWDYSLSSLAETYQRGYRASKSAVRLFQRHPQLQAHIPMFYDKTPIVWGQDKPLLLIRKLGRQFTSSRCVMRVMMYLVGQLEEQFPSPTILRPLYRWITGGYLFLGYRDGLKEMDVMLSKKE